MSTFHWKTETVVPPDILIAIKQNQNLKDELNSWDGQDCNKVFYCPSQLRCHLVNNLGYKDSDRLIGYYVYSKATMIYFDYDSGQRLGDDIGLNNWIQSLAVVT